MGFVWGLWLRLGWCGGGLKATTAVGGGSLLVGF